MASRPHRILYVQHTADTYGSSRSLLRLLGRLPRDRWTPLALLGEEGPLRSQLEALGVKVIVRPVGAITRQTFKSPRLIFFLLALPWRVFQIRRLIRQEQIHIVHSNTGLIVAGGMAAKWGGTPHIWHIRDWFQEFKPIWPLYSRYILWSSFRVLAVSGAIAGQFPPNQTTRVIHNGFSLDEFPLPQASDREAFRRKYRLGNSLVVGCVGRIKWVRKGQEILVRAAALLKQRGIQAKYLLVGGPAPGNEEHLRKLRRLIGDLGLEDDFVLTGELEDARPAYGAMNLFVLPSAQPEPFGGVVMEAMALGLPVIATRIGGSIDQVVDGETGFLIPPAEPEALAEKIALLLNDEPLRRRLGQAGRERIAARFSLDSMVQQFEEVYKTATARAEL